MRSEQNRTPHNMSQTQHKNFQQTTVLKRLKCGEAKNDFSSILRIPKTRFLISLLYLMHVISLSSSFNIKLYIISRHFFEDYV